MVVYDMFMSIQDGGSNPPCSTIDEFHTILIHMKVCIVCEREFKPSSAHKKCPICRGRAARKVCACGGFMGKASTKCTKCTNRTTSQNGNWKGGFYYKKGYKMMAVNDRGSQRYVFEHILVMEESLGRRLVPGETVHHVNGIRDDNKLKNLELWCKPQPTGIRAKDAYAYALEIVERYRDLYDLPMAK